MAVPTRDGHPGSVRQRRRRAIAMLNTLARMLYEGGALRVAEADTSSWMTNTHDDVNDIMFGITGRPIGSLVAVRRTAG
jgi:hypothetical protein